MLTYTELTKKSLRISFDAHKDQTDKSDLSRLNLITEKDLKRVDKYREAQRILSE